MTATQYGPAVLKAGQDLGITPKGIFIGFATVFVESNWVMYANASVPESMSIPHDAVGSDGKSVGLFQQQVIMGNGWWWGDAATCMDPYKSAVLFFTRLKKLDYNSGAQSPGSYAQAIQQSAFPDRYDQKMSQAQALYDSLIKGGSTVNPAQDPRLTALQAARPDFNEISNPCDNNEDREGTTVDLHLRHTEENSGYDNALGLSNFLKSTEGGNNPVSYHRTISKGQNDDGVTVVNCVDISQAAWAVGASNLRSINTCYASSSVNWSRQQWITNLGRCIDVMGYLTVRDWINCGQNGAPQVCAGPAYGQNPPVVSDHRYCTNWLKDGNNHTDVGDNYPWDLDAAAVAKYWSIANGSIAPTPKPSPTPAPPDPTQNPQLEVLIQTRGRFAMLGGQTMIETLAELRDKLTGSTDSGKQGYTW